MDSLEVATRARSRLNIALHHGLASSTRRGYNASVKEFLTFCKNENIPAAFCFPAHELLLCAFAAQSVARHSGQTASKKIAALKSWHTSHNMPWNGSPRLSLVLKGSQRHSRSPVTVHMLRLLTQHLSSSDPFDAAVLACALTAFWGQARLGELLPASSSKSAATDSSVPTRAHFTHKFMNNIASLIIHLPRTKTKSSGEDIILVHQNGVIDPLPALANHLHLNNFPCDLPLFTYTSPSKSSFRILTKNAFLKRCNEIWRSHGFPTVTGHCFRIGGTTEYLLCGVDPNVVRIMGRWSSDAFMRYWRNIDELVPTYASNLPSRIT
ncbi:hypothetical protein CPC08DRAFT_745502 [Agrocybe pediades]|nr:hypothetical protein CPC08DRAFT_745502 [Agrocybe pediades]